MRKSKSKQLRGAAVRPSSAFLSCTRHHAQGQTLDLQVSLQSARGLPQRIVAQSKSLYIAFNFFAQSEPIRSPRVALTSINPKVRVGNG